MSHGDLDLFFKQYRKEMENNNIEKKQSGYK